MCNKEEVSFHQKNINLLDKILKEIIKETKEEEEGIYEILPFPSGTATYMGEFNIRTLVKNKRFLEIIYYKAEILECRIKITSNGKEIFFIISEPSIESIVNSVLKKFVEKKEIHSFFIVTNLFKT